MDNEKDYIPAEELDRFLLSHLELNIAKMERINLTSNQKTSNKMVEAIMDYIKEEVDKNVVETN